MKIHQISQILQELTPIQYAESFDNTGLLVGHPNDDVHGVLICHDALETVIDEAIEKKCNLVVCFHPIWFKEIKRLNGNDYVERSIIKAIKNNIAIYGLHTALDNHFYGVNDIMLKKLGVETSEILIPKTNFIQKLVTYCPANIEHQLLEALFNAGAGNIGNYDQCSFRSQGKGTYRGNDLSNPTIGEKGVRSDEKEVKIEVIFEKYLQSKILSTLKTNHVFEEVAYEIYQLENIHQKIGLGKFGMLKNPIETDDFFDLLKSTFKVPVIRHSNITKSQIQKIAFLGGSGSFAIKNAIGCGSDIYITSDLKYHDFFLAENKIILADIGHFESERYIKNYIFDFLKEKITNFAIILSETNTNPVNYY